MQQGVEEILDFWFGEARQQPTAASAQMGRWFGGGREFDEELRRRYAGLAARAAAGELVDWPTSAEGRLALILLLDQLPRNLHRGAAAAFAQDPAAQRLCLDGLEAGEDRRLSPMERGFFYMPLQHAEDLALQDRSVACYESLRDAVEPAWRPLVEGMLEYARDHHRVIARFGRFPHRNAVLGRAGTAEEEAFLAGGADRYGQ